LEGTSPKEVLELVRARMQTKRCEEALFFLDSTQEARKSISSDAAQRSAEIHAKALSQEETQDYRKDMSEQIRAGRIRKL